jgi:hypothetical protein
MATSNSQRYLSRNGDDTDLALAMYWGTVLEQFYAKTFLWNSIHGGGVGDGSMGNVVASKIVQSGKSWEFPIIGDDPTPEEHTPGVELLGQDVAIDKGTIPIDNIMVAHYDIAGDHTQLAHFEALEPFARKLGRSLATQFDQRLIQLGINAARTAASTGFHNGGNVQTRTAGSVEAAYALSSGGADNISDDIAELARLMDEDNVPEDGRFLLITPYIREVLTLGDRTTWFDRDLSAATSDLNSRRLGVIHGFTMLGPTNHIPTTNITTGPSQYQGIFAVGASPIAEPVALALCGAQEGSAAIGYVAAGDPKLGPIYAHRHYDERRNTTFMKAQMMNGADVLAPWCAGSIEVASS